MNSKGNRNIEFNEDSLTLRSHPEKIKSKAKLHPQPTQQPSQTEETFRHFLELTKDIILTFDKTGNIIEINPQACQLTGYSLDKLYKMNFINDLVIDEDRNIITKALNNLIAGKDQCYEVRWKNKDGSIIHLEGNSTAVFSGNGQFISTRCILRDITEHKKAEEEVRKSRESEKMLFDSIPHPAMIINQERKVVAANKVALDIGAVPGDYCWKEFGKTDYISEEDKKRFCEGNVDGIKCTFCLADEAIENKTTTNAPNVNMFGKIWDVYWRYLGQNINGDGLYLHYAYDITERKKAEEALQENEERFRQMSENIRDVFYLYSKDYSRVHYVSPGFEKIWDRNIKEIYENPWLFADSIHPDDRPAVLERKQNILDTENFKDTAIEYRIIDAEENIRWIRDEMFPVYDKDGNLTRVAGTAREITSHKQAQQKLWDSEERYRVIFQQAADSVVLIDAETGELVNFNDKAHENLGYTHEEFQKLKISDFEVVESTEQVAKHMEKVVREGADTFETKHRTKDGQIRNISVNSKVISIGGRKFCQSTWRDITDRKKAERAIEESELKFRAIFDNAIDGILLVEEQTKRFFTGNKSISQMLGYSLEEIKNLQASDIHPSEAMPYVIEQFDKQSKGEVSLAANVPVKRKNGSIFYADINSSPITLAGKRYLLGIFRDITERKDAEQKIRQYQAKLKSMTTQILLTEDNEKKRLAAGLHDNICQKLALAKFQLQSSIQSLPKNSSLAQLNNICDQIDIMIEDIHGMVFQLSNPVLRELGLVAAVDKLLTEEIQQKHNIKTELQNNNIGKLNDILNASLFRNIRELLINIVKHANAANVKVDIYKTDESLKISVQDDGVGFDVPKILTKDSNRGFGLFSIKEQLETINGNLKIDSTAGHGTKATITVPLTKK